MGRWLCFYKKANVVFFSVRKGHRLSFGPSWYMVLVLLFGAAYAFGTTILAFSNPIQRFILIMLWMNTTMNLLMVSLADPGYILGEEEYDCEQPITCTVCNMRVSPTSHHCQDCGLCVEGFDHHCFWVGKCIGGGNMKYFANFTLSVVVSFLYIIVSRIPIVFRFINSLCSVSSSPL
ncbi:hypothetical protein BLSTO_03067 [Blastocystis sp. subtype 1]